jgi:hypothetical protein
LTCLSLSKFTLLPLLETTAPPNRRENKEEAEEKAAKMAAPEAPLRYVGIVRESPAFRLMKQMVDSPHLPDIFIRFTS